MSEYKRELLTEREKEYFDCDVEMPSSASSAASLFGSVALSFIAALFRSVFVPSSSYGKEDRRLMHNIRMAKYTRYKQAVLRKAKDEPRRGDEKILKKLQFTVSLEGDTLTVTAASASLLTRLPTTSASTLL